MATDPSEHEKAMPIVAAHLAKIERAVARTRASHAGQPFAVVHQALAEALRNEGAQRVVPQVVEELTRQISEAVTGPSGAAG
jgi:rubrerythrin